MSKRHLLILLFFILIGCKPDPVEFFPATSEPAIVEKGRRIVHGLAACGYCHGATADPGSPLSGGRVMSDIYGDVAAANITQAKSGIADWTTTDIVNALRSSIRPDGSMISTKAHRGYEWMSDEDTIAVVSYLLTEPPVENEVERRDLGFISRNTTGFFDTRREVKGYVAPVSKTHTVEYGEYLLDQVARCTQCHNSEADFLSGEGYLAGGATIKTDRGEKTAPAIVNSQIYAIGSWSENDIVNYLKTGETPDGRLSSSDYCPIDFYKNALDEDIRALAAYLKTVPG